jgi:hypothetical protein
MHMIVYTSELNKNAGDVDPIISGIIQTAKRENAKRYITGVLFFENNRFLQIIEGEESHLRQLMKNIENDNRHKNIQILMDTDIEKRGFQSWNMDSFRLKAGKSFDADTLGRLTQSYQKSLQPSTDVLVMFYKSLLAEQSIAHKSSMM